MIDAKTGWRSRFAPILSDDKYKRAYVRDALERYMVACRDVPTKRRIRAWLRATRAMPPHERLHFQRGRRFVVWRWVPHIGPMNRIELPMSPIFHTMDQQA